MVSTVELGLAGAVGWIAAYPNALPAAGRRGGDCRPPRRPLEPEVVERITADTEAVLAKGYR